MRRRQRIGTTAGVTTAVLVGAGVVLTGLQGRPTVTALAAPLQEQDASPGAGPAPGRLAGQVAELQAEADALRDELAAARRAGNGGATTDVRPPGPVGARRARPLAGAAGAPPAGHVTTGASGSVAGGGAARRPAERERGDESDGPGEDD
ncbi:MAG TPA: hypothetical protein VI248_26920 [Kineosporiaceae bacterium]